MPNEHADPKGQSVEDFSQMSGEELAKMLTPGESDKVTEPEPTPEPAPESAPEPEQSAQPEGTSAEDNPEVEPEVKEEDKQRSLEALKKEHEHLQALYGRQTAELGRLRQQVPQKPTQEEFDNDAVAATEKLQRHTQVNADIQRKEAEAAQLAFVANNVRWHSQYTPDLEANKEGIRNLLITQDGFSPTDVDKFMANIYTMNNFGVNQLNRRVNEIKRIAALEQEIKHLKTVPTKAVEKMVSANQQGQVVTAATGESSDPLIGQVSDPVILAGLSDEELLAQLRLK